MSITLSDRQRMTRLYDMEDAVYQRLLNMHPRGPLRPSARWMADAMAIGLGVWCLLYWACTQCETCLDERSNAALDAIEIAEAEEERSVSLRECEVLTIGPPGKILCECERCLEWWAWRVRP